MHLSIRADRSEMMAAERGVRVAERRGKHRRSGRQHQCTLAEPILCSGWGRRLLGWGSEGQTTQHGRSYDTGDLVQWNADGNLVFLNDSASKCTHTCAHGGIDACMLAHLHPRTHVCVCACKCMLSSAWAHAHSSQHRHRGQWHQHSRVKQR